MDREQGRRLAEEFIATDIETTIGERVVIVAERETSSHWIFAYQTRRHVEEGVLSAALAGNLPVHVSKENGVVSMEIADW